MALLSGIPLQEIWNKYSETGFFFLDGDDMFTSALLFFLASSAIHRRHGWFRHLARW